jgi:hypothetical protein
MRGKTLLVHKSSWDKKVQYQQKRLALSRQSRNQDLRRAKKIFARREEIEA